MDIFIVLFAATPGDMPPKAYILDDKKYDDWVLGEPQEGYACWKVLWHGRVEAAYTALNDLRDICHHEEGR